MIFKCLGSALDFLNLNNPLCRCFKSCQAISFLSLSAKKGVKVVTSASFKTV